MILFSMEVSSGFEIAFALYPRNILCFFHAMDRKGLAFEFRCEATKVGVEFGIQIRDNQSGTTLGAEEREWTKGLRVDLCKGS